MKEFTVVTQPILESDQMKHYILSQADLELIVEHGLESRLLVGKTVSESLRLPDNHSSITALDVVKMLYLVSGWIGEKHCLHSEHALEKIALIIHDTFAESKE